MAARRVEVRGTARTMLEWSIVAVAAIVCGGLLNVFRVFFKVGFMLPGGCRLQGMTS